jgi:hypothetical protein
MLTQFLIIWRKFVYLQHGKKFIETWILQINNGLILIVMLLKFYIMMKIIKKYKKLTKKEMNALDKIFYVVY